MSNTTAYGIFYFLEWKKKKKKILKKKKEINLQKGWRIKRLLACATVSFNSNSLINTDSTSRCSCAQIILDTVIRLDFFFTLCCWFSFALFVCAAFFLVQICFTISFICDITYVGSSYSYFFVLSYCLSRIICINVT